VSIEDVAASRVRSASPLPCMPAVRMAHVAAVQYTVAVVAAAGIVAALYSLGPDRTLVVSAVAAPASALAIVVPD
jgi:hypothetical protein